MKLNASPQARLVESSAKQTLWKFLVVAALPIFPAACATAALLPSATAASIPPEIENEQVLSINKQPWHATLMPYANLSEALRARRSESSFARSLNGQWKFNWVKRPEQRPVDFYHTDFDDSKWKTIPVPSNWSGRRVFLNFDGVDSAFFVWVNGQKVGYNVNSRNSAECDITPILAWFRLSIDKAREPKLWRAFQTGK